MSITQYASVLCAVAVVTSGEICGLITYLDDGTVEVNLDSQCGLAKKMSLKNIKKC